MRLRLTRSKPLLAVPFIAALTTALPVAAQHRDAGARPDGHAAVALADELVPGAQLGPIRLGMSSEQVRALGLPIEYPRAPSFGINTTVTTFSAGPYVVSFDGGRVVNVAAPLSALAHGLRYRGRALGPGASAADVLALVPGCHRPRPTIGARVTQCAGGVEIVELGPNGSLVSISVVPASQIAPQLPAAGVPIGPRDGGAWPPGCSIVHAGRCYSLAADACAAAGCASRCSILETYPGRVACGR